VAITISKVKRFTIVRCTQTLTCLCVIMAHMLTPRQQRWQQKWWRLRLWWLQLLEYYHLTDVIPGESGSAISPQFFLLHLFQMKTSSNQWNEIFTDGHPSCHQSSIVSKQWREHEALSLTNGLTASFLYPQPASWIPDGRGAAAALLPLSCLSNDSTNTGQIF